MAIVGAGIAGASMAAHLPPALKVLILEAEDAPGFHSTGRSAAIYSGIYGNQLVRTLSRASFPFLAAPSAGFCDVPLVSPRGLLFTARADQMGAFEQMRAQPDVRAATTALTGEQVCALCPRLKPGYAIQALYERGGYDIDVGALHGGLLRQARRNGAQLIMRATVTALVATRDSWRIATSAGDFEATIVVNAAGAWADKVAGLAGAAACRLEARQRTMVLMDVAGEPLPHDSPMVVDVEEQFYFKPESGGVLLSPADETPVPPGDVQPEELAVATAIDRVETATTFAFRRMRSAWAGIRCFAPDRSPVVGFDPDVPRFFWLAGQGGYGIQTAPALGRLSAALVTGDALPTDLMDGGVTVGELSPARAELQARVEAPC